MVHFHEHWQWKFFCTEQSGSQIHGFMATCPVLSLPTAPASVRRLKRRRVEGALFQLDTSFLLSLFLTWMGKGKEKASVSWNLDSAWSGAGKRGSFYSSHASSMKLPPDRTLGRLTNWWSGFIPWCGINSLSMVNSGRHSKNPLKGN